MAYEFDPETQRMLAGIGLASVWSVIGRLLFHTNQVRIGRRKKFFSLQLVWELGVALFMGVIAKGLATHLNLSGDVEAAFIATLGYAGPQIVDRVLDIIAPTLGKAKKEETTK